MGSLNRDNSQSKFQIIGGYHGEPNRWCHFGEDGDMDETRFLSWHRAYLLRFENYLREASGKNISIPYYDCASDYSVFNNELPQRLTRRPFNAGWVSMAERYTQREMGLDELNLGTCRDKVRRTFRKRYSSTLDFQEDLRKGIHNFLHLWLGSDMADLSYSSFDPIFWFHHANIDRLWQIWQKSEGKRVQEREIANREEFLDWDFSRRGFRGSKYGHFMDSDQLPSLGGASGRITVVYDDESNIFSSSQGEDKREINEEAGEKKDINIVLKNLAPTADSYIIRASSKIDNKTIPLGDFTIMGYGACCEHNICSSKKNETIQESIDVSDVWNQINKKEKLNISLHIFNLSKKKKIDLNELQSIFKTTIQQIKNVEFIWEEDNNNSRNSESYPQIVVENN
eukprot:TRINITY_DN2227_c0_g1_i1.p1 TRINITY_DN2227_c0_g1~~TRINITY_DN2227_c0_g1_i1.p1  ORF type:complete len:459 (-),score=129.05 TRINITY_DN2227_c0_g1_i1:40-1233(-)